MLESLPMLLHPIIWFLLHFNPKRLLFVVSITRNSWLQQSLCRNDEGNNIISYIFKNFTKWLHLFVFGKCSHLQQLSFKWLWYSRKWSLDYQREHENKKFVLCGQLVQYRYLKRVWQYNFIHQRLFFSRPQLGLLLCRCQRIRSWPIRMLLWLEWW